MGRSKKKGTARCCGPLRVEFATFSRPELEAQLGGENELSCVHSAVAARVCQPIDPPEVTAVEVSVRVAEMRCVGEVDRLGAELQVEALGQFEVTGQGEIEVE